MAGRGTEGSQATARTALRTDIAAHVLVSLGHRDQSFDGSASLQQIQQEKGQTDPPGKTPDRCETNIHSRCAIPCCCSFSSSVA